MTDHDNGAALKDDDAWITETQYDEFGRVMSVSHRPSPNAACNCPTCNGRGGLALFTTFRRCPECGGSGKVMPGHSVTYTYHDAEVCDRKPELPPVGEKSPAPLEGDARPYYHFAPAGGKSRKVYLEWDGWQWRCPEET